MWSCLLQLEEDYSNDSSPFRRSVGSVSVSHVILCTIDQVPIDFIDKSREKTGMGRYLNQMKEMREHLNYFMEKNYYLRSIWRHTHNL